MYKIRLYLEVYCEQWQYCWGTEGVYTPLPKHLAGGGGGVWPGRGASTGRHHAMLT